MPIRKFNSVLRKLHIDCRDLVVAFLSNTFSIKGCLPICHNISLNFDRVSITILMSRKKGSRFAFYRLHSHCEKATSSTYKTRELPLQKLPAKVALQLLAPCWDPDINQQTKQKQKEKEAQLTFFFRECINRMGMSR